MTETATGVRGSVLLVDDEPKVIAAYKRSLVAAGYVVELATNGRQAVEQLANKRFDVIVSDISMPQLDGIGLLRAVREHDLDVPVVLVTGGASVETAIQAVEYGALRYLHKPVDLSELTAIIEQAVRLGKVARVKREAIELLGDQSRELGDRASLDLALGRVLDELWMVYQPIVHYPERRLVAHEALLRSNEPTLPHPGAILDAAQRLGKLNELGRAVRRHVAGTVSVSTMPQVFVNLHPSDLLDEDLYSSEAPLSRIAERVVLEITERASLDAIDDVQARVASLRQLGFRIAIDDMGAGYAGLASIAQLEPETMKIDMGLVRDLDVSGTKQKLVGALVSLCAEMHVQVIAEGIETTRERDALQRLGCNIMQGYLFAKPGMPFPSPVF
jgi:EAL domain-containing protein (putative c-di-GMP-specific phosphodiesterase class I)/ActR/RegA family two-component response regulator